MSSPPRAPRAGIPSSPVRHRNRGRTAKEGDLSATERYSSSALSRLASGIPATLGKLSASYLPTSVNSFFSTLGGAPDWNLYVWHWDKQKLIAAAKGVGWGNANGAATYQCDFCPVDNTVLCVSGNGFVKFLRQQEGMLRPVQPSAGAAAPKAATAHGSSDPKIGVERRASAKKTGTKSRTPKF